MMPHSIDCEKGLLCSFLLQWKEVGGMCAEIGVTPDHFYLPAHGTIYEVLGGFYQKNVPPDLILLTQTLHDRKLLDKVGGPAYLAELQDYVATAAVAEEYLEVVVSKHTLRQIIKVCTECTKRGYEPREDTEEFVDFVEKSIFDISKDRYKNETASLRDMVLQAITKIEELYSRRGQITGVSTGFSNFDKMTDGLHGAEMIVIAARPSMGKTAFAMNIAEHVALEQKKAVAVFSLEMSAQQLVQRMLCSRARVNLGSIRNGMMGDQEFPKLQVAASHLANAKIFIDDTSSIPILELRAKARRMKSQHDIAAIFIDYLQLIRAPSLRKQDSRQLEIAEISSGLKALAKELNIPIVVLAQLNRNPEQRTGDSKGRPRLSDLRESGSIEQDADLVGLLVREEYYADNDEERGKLKGKATLIIAKQRNGPVGDVPLTFLNEYTRFEDRMDEPEAP